MKKLKFNFKKVISIILVLMVLLGCLALAVPTNAYATDISHIDKINNIEEYVTKKAREIERSKQIEIPDGVECSARYPVNFIPKYNQRNYLCPYGDYGTVSSHGCGVACLSMVATYLKDNWSLTPDAMAELFGSYNTEKGSLWILFEDSAEELRLGEVRRVYSWDDGVEEALRNGQVVISLQVTGLFTRSGHFIVLTGINENGKVMVNDPNGDNWNKNSEMKEKFKEGFEFSDIYDNGTVYWIYPEKTPNVTVSKIPDYNQNDYVVSSEDCSFSESYASSVTALSMVTTYLHDDLTVTPDVLAEKFKDFNVGNSSIYGDSLGVFENCGEILGIDGIQEVCNWNTGEVEKALENGQPVVSCQMGGIWGSRSHIVVLIKNSETGKIIVYNPCGEAIHNTALEQKMLDGFEAYELAQNSFICWIFPEKDGY